jgi:Flp pilus assembly protein TadG
MFAAKTRSLISDQRGGIALLFAIALVPLATGIGVAIDYSIASNAKATMAAAADAAVLAGAKTRGTAEQREKAASDVLSTNLSGTNLADKVKPKFTNLMSGIVNTGYRVELEAEVKGLFGGLTKSRVQHLKAFAEASSSNEDPIEIAFVLDTTDSMAGDRIVTLKRATTDIVDEIIKKTQRPDLVKVGVVPFSQYVNVGLSRRAETWLDVAADYQKPTYDHCWNHHDKIGEKNCRVVHHPAKPAVPPHKCMRDGRERQCGGSAAQPARSETVCDPIYSPVPRRICEKRGGEWVRWNGCVGSRSYPLNTVDGQYDTKVPGILGISCGTPILDLTTNLSSVKSTISGLNTNGQTYLPSGLIWGWRMLSPGAPLASSSASPSANKFMIIVTDGRNTKSPNYPRHDNNDGAEADKLTRETCRNVARDSGNAIKVFTIAFEMDGLDAKAILQECAAITGGQFYDASDAAKLKDAFGQIFDKIFTLKLTH